MSNHIVSDYLGMAVDPNDWPAYGEKVIFLNKNGPGRSRVSFKGENQCLI